MNNALIQKLGHFTKLSHEDKERLVHAASTRVQCFEPGEDIVRESERPEAIVLVLSGWAKRYQTLRNGRRQTTALLLPGDLCDLNVFVLRHRDHSIGAITGVEAAEITQVEHDLLMASGLRLASALAWTSAVTTSVARRWVFNLSHRYAVQRMAHLFCELFVRSQVIGQASEDAYHLPLTQTELGDTLGISEVHTNRTIQELRNTGMILLEGGVLTILNLPALRSLAVFNADYLHLNHDGAHLDASD